MKLTLIRDKSLGSSTLGHLSVDGVFQCVTLEDITRPIKVAGKTAIPTGTYEVQLTMSNRFKKVLPLLLKVPNFEGVRIHCGNTSEDTEGCILVGKTIGGDRNSIGSSKLAFAELMTKMQNYNGKITLEIK